MRLRVSHGTTYSYAPAALYAIQTLRVFPRGHDGQFVSRWRIDINTDCRLERDEDPFGNLTHTFTIDGPIETLRVTVEGEVETEDRGGLVQGTVEPLPAAFFLRETTLTAPDAALKSFAADLAARERDKIDALHTLLRQLHAELRFDTEATSPATTAREAFAARHGVCQDFAHIFIAASRLIGVPARYVAGYLLEGEHGIEREAGHAWAEAYLPPLGWIGFDPANGICVGERHLRVAVGLDALGAAPMRGARRGGGHERLSVRALVSPARPTLTPSADSQSQ